MSWLRPCFIQKRTSDKDITSPITWIHAWPLLRIGRICFQLLQISGQGNEILLHGLPLLQLLSIRFLLKLKSSSGKQAKRKTWSKLQTPQFLHGKHWFHTIKIDTNLRHTTKANSIKKDHGPGSLQLCSNIVHLSTQDGDLLYLQTGSLEFLRCCPHLLCQILWVQMQLMTICSGLHKLLPNSLSSPQFRFQFRSLL